MKRSVSAAVGALVVLLAACSGPAPVPPSSPASAGGPSIAAADMPRIDGSTANIPLISLTLQRLTGATEAEADAAVKTSGTSDAYRALVQGEADLLVVYEADQKVKAELEGSGVPLEMHPVGKDALVFFTNSSNPVTSLTTAEYRAIYVGKTTNWAQVGGPNKKLVAFQRPEESGSQALLRKYVVGTDKMGKAPSELIAGEMGEIITGVSQYANTGNALGYSVYYYLANMYAVDGITMMGVGGVMPTSATIADGTYPYGNDFYVVVRADEPAGSPARKVMEWLLSPAGQRAVTDAGYVPAVR